MRMTGIVRPMDDLGRVVIPKEIRRTIGIREGQDMEIFATDKGVFIQKYDENDETQPDIFKECGNHAQPPIKTEIRKNLVIHDRNSNGDYYLRLTDDQIKLLDYLMDEYIVDCNYEIIESHTFKVV